MSVFQGETMDTDPNFAVYKNNKGYIYWSAARN